MTDEGSVSDSGSQGWLDKLTAPDSFRSYRPAVGPDEPAEAPLGRASASGTGRDDGDEFAAQGREQEPTDTNPTTDAQEPRT